MSERLALEGAARARHPDADCSAVLTRGLVRALSFGHGPARRGRPRARGWVAMIAGTATVLRHKTDELEAVLVDKEPSYDELESVLETYELICAGTVVRDQDRLHELAKPLRNGTAIEAAAVERWRAPVITGDELVFFANHRKGFYEVRVHVRSHWVERERVGQGHHRIVMYRGRPLIGLEPPASPIAVSDTEAARAAAAWRRAALEEQLAAAAFERAALEVRAAGLPEALVTRHLSAANDEREHARLCEAVAHALDGTHGRPPIVLAARPRPLSPSALARAAIREGFVTEAVAALEARDALRSCELALGRHALRIIARDEAGHARLALELARAADPAAAWRALPNEGPASDDLDGPGLEHLGVLSSQRREALSQRAWPSLRRAALRSLRNPTGLCVVKSG